MKHPAALIGTVFGIAGLITGGFFAFSFAAASIPPGEELGLIGAGLGAGVGLLSAAIGVVVDRRYSRRLV